MFRGQLRDEGRTGSFGVFSKFFSLLVTSVGSLSGAGYLRDCIDRVVEIESNSMIKRVEEAHHLVSPRRMKTNHLN